VSGAWTLTSVTAINNTTNLRTDASAFPKEELADGELRSQQHAELGASSLTVTDSAGRVTRYSNYGNFTTYGIKTPSSATADNITYTSVEAAAAVGVGLRSEYAGQGGTPIKRT